MSSTSALTTKAEYETLLTSYVKALAARSNKEKLVELSELRGIPLAALQQAGIFYVGEMAEMLLPNYIEAVVSFGVISDTNRKPIFRNRWVIPILGANGLVQNLVGYSMEANERYIYGTARYYRRTDTLWGLDALEVAYDLGYAILTEGITDAIRMRSIGYPNTFAMCGTHKSDFIVQQLNRCDYGVIRIPDRDAAGARALKGWDFNRHITINVPIMYKDVDEMCNVGSDSIEVMQTYTNDCIGWLKWDKHKGQRCYCENVTIM